MYLRSPFIAFGVPVQVVLGLSVVWMLWVGSPLGYVSCLQWPVGAMFAFVVLFLLCIGRCRIVCRFCLRRGQWVCCAGGSQGIVAVLVRGWNILISVRHHRLRCLCQVACSVIVGKRGCVVDRLENAEPPCNIQVSCPLFFLVCVVVGFFRSVRCYVVPGMWHRPVRVRGGDSRCWVASGSAVDS